MKYVQILASTFAFAAAAALLVQMRQQPGQNYLFVVLFLLCGANLLSRLTEAHINDQIAEAEEKVAKRVLRRLAKVMPELLNEYFKAQVAKPVEKLSNVVVATKQGALATQALLDEFYKKQAKCTGERDAKGTTVITASPDCVATGVEIAHSVSRSES